MPPTEVLKERRLCFTYRVFDFHLRSNVSIPGLVPLKEPLSGKELSVHFGIWPEALGSTEGLAEPSHAGPSIDEDGQPMVRIWRTAGRASLRLAYHNGLEFFIDLKANEIWAQWSAELALEDASAYLLGPVLGIFLRASGETCLHASAVAMDDTAVVFVGPPGAGKSTTAAALNSRGCALLCDDIVLLREREDGRFCVVPSHPFLSLWPDSVNLIACDPESLPRIFSNFDKRRLALTESSSRFETRTLPLAAIYILDARIENPVSEVKTVGGQAALISLLTDTYATYALDAQDRAEELKLLAKLVSRVPMRTIQVRSGTLDEMCSSVWKSVGWY